MAEVGVRMSEDKLFAGVKNRKHFKYRLRKKISGKAIDQVTMGKIADILQQRGETAEALRIRREEQLQSTNASATCGNKLLADGILA